VVVLHGIVGRLSRDKESRCGSRLCRGLAAERIHPSYQVSCDAQFSDGVCPRQDAQSGTFRLPVPESLSLGERRRIRSIARHEGRSHQQRPRAIR
jgi:hypothetical protein